MINRVLCVQEPSLSLAFDYAEHDLYEMLRFHRERGMAAPAMEAYTIKSLMWQLLQGLQHLHANWIMHRQDAISFSTFSLCTHRDVRLCSKRRRTAILGYLYAQLTLKGRTCLTAGI